MKKTYKQFTADERDVLVIGQSKGHSLRTIARFLGRSASSLSREISRNTTETGYRPHRAGELAMKRKKEGHRRNRLRDQKLREKVEGFLAQKWSPEIIAGELNREAGKSVICHETIYRWIYDQAPHLGLHLVMSRKRRHRRVSVKWKAVRIVDRVSIGERPREVNDRGEPGHWESDLIVGSGRTAIQMVVERKARLCRLKRIADKTAQSAQEGLRTLLGPLRQQMRKTITYDNGAENSLHREINAHLGTRSYFCAPYHSWEKGTVENTNGLVRRFLPKKTNFDEIPEEAFGTLERWLNTRPRKCLNFRTPEEAFRTEEICCT